MELSSENWARTFRNWLMGLCIGRSLCLAALGAGLLKKGIFLLHNPVQWSTKGCRSDMDQIMQPRNILSKHLSNKNFSSCRPLWWTGTLWASWRRSVRRRCPSRRRRTSPPWSRRTGRRGRRSCNGSGPIDMRCKGKFSLLTAGIISLSTTMED